MNAIIERKDRKIITKDWLSIFPDFGEYKPMHILRRNGFFLCGIHMQTYSGNTDYEPLFHIHNLAVEFPSISLSSATFLLNTKNAKDTVSLNRHNKEFVNIAQRLGEQVILLQSSALNIGRLTSNMKDVVSQSIGFPADTLRDIVLGFFGCNRLEDAEKEIMVAKKIISQWPDDAKRRFGGENGWEEQVRKLMNINTLQNTTAYQLQKYKVTALNDYGLDCY